MRATWQCVSHLKFAAADQNAIDHGAARRLHPLRPKLLACFAVGAKLIDGHVQAGGQWAGQFVANGQRGGEIDCLWQTQVAESGSNLSCTRMQIRAVLAALPPGHPLMQCCCGAQKTSCSRMMTVSAWAASLARGHSEPGAGQQMRRSAAANGHSGARNELIEFLCERPHDYRFQFP